MACSGTALLFVSGSYSPVFDNALYINCALSSLPQFRYVCLRCNERCVFRFDSCMTRQPFISAFIHSFTGAYSPEWTFGLPFRGFLITHTYRHTVGLVWTSDQPVAETSTTDKHPCPERDSNSRHQQPSGRMTRQPTHDIETRFIRAMVWR
jgi:hypothetical protein